MASRDGLAGGDLFAIDFNDCAWSERDTGYRNVVLGVQVDGGIFRGWEFGDVYKDHGGYI